MKYKLKTMVSAAALAMALTQIAQAIPITGNIGFSGTAQLNKTSAQTATDADTWGNNIVGSTSGAFNTVALGSLVTLASPWQFTSGSINSFWTVGGFTFNLTSSSIYSQDSMFLNTVLTGIISGNGYTPTAYTGAFSAQNPPSDGQFKYTESMSFTPSNAVPDGGSTLGLLGVACIGLVFIKRKIAMA